MDALHPRTDTRATLTPPQSAISLGNKDPAITTPAANNQNDSSTATNGTVNLSNLSIKLSASTPVKSSDQVSSIETKDHAQQALKQLLTDFQSNPSQAQGAHSNVTHVALKALLG